MTRGFLTFVRIIEADPRTSHNEKAIMIFKAWSHYETNRSMFSLLLELGRVY
jgi:hypothetical protein